MASIFVIVNCCLLVVLLADWLIVTKVDPESFSLEAIPAFTGALTANNDLAAVEKMFLGKIRGPESMGIYKDELYSGLADGRIVKMNPSTGVVTTVVERLGEPPCGKIEYETTCGRPLGIRIQGDYLYAVDAYLGIFRTDLITGQTELLLSAKTVFPDGKPALFLNDIEVTSQGIIYVTDSSYKWTRADHCYVGFENRPYARLIRFDPFTNTSEILLHSLYFANGLQLSADETYLLITEMARSRITKYYVSGPKQGSHEMFADNLPGLPDNIRRSERGGYWVAFAVVRHPEKFSVWDTLSNKPWIRRQMAKIFHKNTIGSMVPRYCLAVELDSSGQIIRSVHDPAATTMTAISEVLEYNHTLYIGSYFMPFIGKVDSK